MSRNSSVCPSEIARAADPDDWRQLLPEVHRLVDELLAGGEIEISQKGVRQKKRPRGPYRIHRADEDQTS
jgi:hypothetical protein